ncbi:MAG: hypothetical protein ACKO96_41260, partial [Flammeovirgaceae bacterium]
MLQAIYLPLFRKLRQSSNSMNLVKQHAKCVDSTLRPFFTTKYQSIKFANHFLKNQAASIRSFINSKIFNY